MPQITYCRGKTVQSLRTWAQGSLDWYFDLNANETPMPLTDDGATLTERIEISNFWQALTLPEEGATDRVRSSTDRENVLVVYRGLGELKPVQAADGRLWTYLCHTVCSEYVKRRWMGRRPADERTAMDLARNHFFAYSNRSFIRDNGVSRLWWIGHVAHEAVPGEEQEFIDLVLSTQEIRQQLLERPTLTTNPRVLEQIYRVMQDYRAQHDATLLNRGPFREWMKNLNRRGGVILLDALDDVQLEELLRCEAERALEAAAGLTA